MPNAVLRKGIARFLKHLEGTYQLCWESKSGASILRRNKLLMHYAAVSLPWEVDPGVGGHHARGAVQGESIEI